ncbi:hypothetical protein K8Q98_00910 [Candidatus Nomurabacteria bacterium]|nr:hypothetical protein [Candidatus Nomurabacteria bacterium]
MNKSLTSSIIIVLVFISIVVWLLNFSGSTPEKGVPNDLPIIGFWKLEKAGEVIYYEFKNGGLNCPMQEGYVSILGGYVETIVGGLCYKMEGDKLISVYPNLPVVNWSITNENLELVVAQGGFNPTLQKDSSNTKMVYTPTTPKEAELSGDLKQ